MAARRTRARLFFLVGFLGGYTTFSSFAFEAHVLWERGQIGRAVAYLARERRGGVRGGRAGGRAGAGVVGAGASRRPSLRRPRTILGVDE